MQKKNNRLESNGQGNYFPELSPDGQQIVFITYTENPTRGMIYVMNADGSNLKQLTDGSANDEHLTWLPDGKWIAFERDAWEEKGGRFEQTYWAICVMDVRGANVKILVEEQTK